MKKLLLLVILLVGCAPAKYPESKVNCIKQCMDTNTCMLRLEESTCPDGRHECAKLFAKDVPNKWNKCEEVCK